MVTKPTRPDSQVWLDSRTLGLSPLPQPVLLTGELRTPRQSSSGPADPLVCRPAVATSCLLCSPDRYHQAAQHHAHGYVQQPTDAVLHTNAPHHCLLRTGSDRRGPCPAGSYQHSRTGRYLMPEPILRPQEVGPKRSSSQRVPTALPFDTRLSTECPHQTIRLFQGTLPKAPAPADNEPRGSQRPRVVVPGTARRQGRSPGYLTEENLGGRLHQPMRCMTRAKGARHAVTTYVLHLRSLTPILGRLTALHRRPSAQAFLVGCYLTARLTLLRHGAVRHPEHRESAAEARGVNRERGKGRGARDRGLGTGPTRTRRPDAVSRRLLTSNC